MLYEPNDDETVRDGGTYHAPMGGTDSGTSSTTSRTKTSKYHDEASTSAGGASTATTRRCQGCNRAHHTCRLRSHPDFNKAGSWAGSAAERAIRVWDSSVEVVLPWTARADGLGLPDPPSNTGSSAPRGTSDAPTPPKKKDKPKESKDYYGRGGVNNNNDRRGNGGGGRGGGSSRGVHFDDRNKGMLCRTDIVTHLSCNCGESDINSTYRQCLVSLSTSSTYFTALTLFDTGAYTSFVNREVAKWLEQRQESDFQ